MLYDRYLHQYASVFSHTDRNMWNYEDGCVLIGLLALYRATDDSYYYDMLKRFIDRYIDEDGNIRCYEMEQYNLDFIPTGRVLFELYAHTGEEKYRTAIETLEGQLRRQPRTECGSFWHKAIYPYQVWLDGLYMGLPFYTAYEVQFDNGELLDDVMRQFRNVRAHLYDEKTGLYFHAWDESRKAFWADPQTGLSPNIWLRALGWYLMALADVYELFPARRTEDRQELAALWREAIDGMLRWQDADSGLFYQLPALPDAPGNYLETSGSLMVAYSLLKGVRLGVLHGEEYRRRSEQILLGIALRQFTFHNNQLSLGGMCKGAGLGPEGNLRRDGSVAYYLSEDVVADEQKGTGVCMMAYAEYLRALRADTLAADYPQVGIFTKAYDPILPDDPKFAAFLEQRHAVEAGAKL